MNVLPLLIIGLTIAPFSMAATQLYGEANGFGQFKFAEDGSTLQLNGYLSELGFRNKVPVTEQTDAEFDISFGFDSLSSFTVFTRNADIGLSGENGKVSYFYGNTPLSAMNDQLMLMDRDPDSVAGLFNYSAANQLGIAVGMGGSDGIRYETPKLSDNLVLDMAIVPAEVVGGETGFSFAGKYETEQYGLTAAFELNVELADTQLMRVMGHRRLEQLDLGLGFQLAGNSEADTSARTLFAYLFMPLKFSGWQTQSKTLISFNQLVNSEDDVSSQLYLSFVDEYELTSKVSVYGFVETELANDFEDMTSYLGAGMRMSF